MSPQVKLGFAAVLIAGSAAYLAYLGGTTSWQYYLMVDECVQNNDKLVGHRMRVNGRVAVNSLNMAADRSLATFVLRGERCELQASCNAPLPDNLAEDIDVVVEGTLEQGNLLRGEKVMTRCASKYDPKSKATSQD